MKIFLSSAVNKIDAKGRISIPASFRNVLEFQGYSGVYLFPSFTSNAIDGGGLELINQISENKIIFPNRFQLTIIKYIYFHFIWSSNY